MTKHQWQLPEGVRIDDRAKSLSENLDLAIGPADRHRIGGPAAHQDALEHGLTAVEEFVLAHRRAHPSPSPSPPAIQDPTGGALISSAAGAAGSGRRGPGCRRFAAGR